MPRLPLPLPLLLHPGLSAGAADCCSAASGRPAGGLESPGCTAAGCTEAAAAAACRLLRRRRMAGCSPALGFPGVDGTSGAAAAAVAAAADGRGDVSVAAADGSLLPPCLLLDLLPGALNSGAGVAT